MELETLVVVPSTCCRNGTLDDHGKKRAIRTLATRKESLTHAIVDLYHMAIFA